MAGGLAVATPIGPIISTSITPSKTAGIGDCAPAQFAPAVRQRMRADGPQLTMPDTACAGVTDVDAKALYPRFMLGTAPAERLPAG